MSSASQSVRDTVIIALYNHGEPKDFTPKDLSEMTGLPTRSIHGATYELRKQKFAQTTLYNHTKITVKGIELVEKLTNKPEKVDVVSNEMPIEAEMPELMGEDRFEDRRREPEMVAMEWLSQQKPVEETGPVNFEREYVKLSNKTIDMLLAMLRNRK